MVVLFATMGLGFLITKLGLMDTAFNKKLTRIVLYVTSPLLVLSSVTGSEHPLSNREVLLLTAVVVCCYAALVAVSVLVPKLLRAPARDAGVYRFMFIFSNIGFVGYPVVQALLGDSAIFYVSIFVLFFNLLCFSFGIWLIGGGKGRFRFSWKAFRNPVVISALIAYVFYLTGLRAPTVVSDVISYSGNLTSPLSMIIIGSSLSAIPFRSIFRNGRLYLLLALKMIAMPLLAYAVLHPLVHSELLLSIVVVILAMPIATNSTMLALEYGGDESLASSGVFLSTLVSIFSIPAIMWLLFCR